MKCEIKKEIRYFVNLELDETEARLFKHVVGCWDGQDMCFDRNEVKTFALSLATSLKGFPII